MAPFHFWQFWRTTDERDVGRFLALITELSMDEVRRLGEVTRLAHGDDAAQAAARGTCLPTVTLEPTRHAAGVTLAELTVKRTGEFAQ